jgi:hypothetical protein
MGQESNEVLQGLANLLIAFLVPEKLFELSGGQHFGWAFGQYFGQACFHFFQVIGSLLLQQIYSVGVVENFRTEVFINFHLSLIFCSHTGRCRKAVGFAELLNGCAVFLEQQAAALGAYLGQLMQRLVFKCAVLIVYFLEQQFIFVLRAVVEGPGFHRVIPLMNLLSIIFPLGAFRATFLSVNQKAKYVPSTDNLRKPLWTMVFEYQNRNHRRPGCPILEHLLPLLLKALSVRRFRIEKCPILGHRLFSAENTSGATCWVGAVPFWDNA